MFNGSAVARAQSIPESAMLALRRGNVRPTRFLLMVSVALQRLSLFQLTRFPEYSSVKHYVISTSSYGTGQTKDSNRTPLGLHRIARKIGAGHPMGTVFRCRKAVGLTWDGERDASIVHRILWLEGLEPGYNRGQNVDSFERYIYIHGFGDEMTLGRPRSHGCIHMAANDLIPLFDRVPEGTLVWIGER